jgi:predicted NUDIX family NTP pyrophosphohydrolase
MPKRSAGIAAYRPRPGGIEVLLAHPGGPFWTKKDDGAWSLPKGLYTETENPLEAAKREFAEEIGMAIDGSFTHLGEFSQPGGKIISAWAVEADLNEADFKSNLFEMEWPPRSGKRQEFPEVDRAQWFDLRSALGKIIRGQVPIIQALARHLGQTADVPGGRP